MADLRPQADLTSSGRRPPTCDLATCLGQACMGTLEREER